MRKLLVSFASLVLASTLTSSAHHKTHHGVAYVALEHAHQKMASHYLAR